MCAQIISCFLVYVLLYSICFDSQMGTSPLCHNEGVDDVNETIDLDHDVEGLRGPKLTSSHLRSFKQREWRVQAQYRREREVINLAEEGEKEKRIKIRVKFPKDMKDELIVLLKEFNEIFAWFYQDMPGLDTEIVVHRIPVKLECP